MKTFSSFIFFIISIVFIVSVSTQARAQVWDDFTDGNFTVNPNWTGDATQFEINQSLQLHLRSDGSDTSVLATRSEMIRNTQWSFWMKLSFNTSSNNYARIYLTADTSKLISQVNGYYIQAGGGDDSISIMKQTGVSVEKMLCFKSYRTDHSTNTIRFKITCDENGNWEAMIDTTGGYNYFSEGTFFDDSFTATRWFGLVCRYTSSNATRFYFDDIYVGPIIRDTLPPKVISLEVPTEKRVRITFSEAVQKEGAELVSNYRLISTGDNPDSVIQDALLPAAVTLFFKKPLTEAVFGSIQIRNIADLSGNILTDTIVQFCFYRPKAYDVLINEIMADPDPPVELPVGEYVELYNRTSFPINLKNWSFKYGSYSKIFPSMVIRPKGYLLVVKDSVFRRFADCAELFTSETSLSNEGTTLVLKDSQQHVIHSVAYSSDWFNGSFKGEGGWSLEMTDPSNPCGCGENWGASKNFSGGTPGSANSICRTNPDLTDPYATRAVISDSSVLEVYFSEAMDSASLLPASNWAVGPFDDHPDGVANPVRVVPAPPDFSSAALVFYEIFKKGITYDLSLRGALKDCAGNLCDSSRKIRFAIPDSVTCRDIIINEVLTDPATGGSRFIELFNRSQKIIDLRSMVLSNRDTMGGGLQNSIPLISSGYLLFPGDYVALTSNPDDICEKYRPSAPESILKVSGFPVYGEDTGTVVIARKDNLLVIDRMQYNPEMHYPLLITREGVSLERTNPEMPSGDQNNWHSAAESVGFATPGYQNSHRNVSTATDQEITVEPEIFSPDNDGRDDLLNIIIRKNEPDCAVTITIYDSRGRLVRQLVHNVLTGSEVFFTWDGMNENRGKASLGFYVILIEITRPDGNVRRIKKTAILGGKL